jgi:predicted RNA-binding protein with TRAM domain
VAPSGTVYAVPGDSSALVYFGTHGNNLRYYVQVGDRIVAGATSPILVDGLTNGASYTFKVRAVGMNDELSDWTAESSPVVPIAAVTQPAPATAPTITSVSGVVSMTGCTGRVHFTPPASDGGSAITGYVVTVPGASSSPVQVGTSSPASVPDLTTHANYTFTIQAVTAAGTGAASAPFPAACT